MIKIYYHNQYEQMPLVDLGIHPGLLTIFQELGIVEAGVETIDTREAGRIHRMMRLKEMLGVNLNGAAIIIDLLERIEELEDELERLQREVR